MYMDINPCFAVLDVPRIRFVILYLYYTASDILCILMHLNPIFFLSFCYVG